MCQFLRTDIIQYCHRSSVRHGKTLGEVAHGCSNLAVGATVLTHDELCQFGVWRGDVNRILQTLFIIPHKRSRSFPFPREWLLGPFP